MRRITKVVDDNCHTVLTCLSGSLIALRRTDNDLQKQIVFVTIGS